MSLEHQNIKSPVSFPAVVNSAVTLLSACAIKKARQGRVMYMFLDPSKALDVLFSLYFVLRLN